MRPTLRLFQRRLIPHKDLRYECKFRSGETGEVIAK